MTIQNTSAKPDTHSATPFVSPHMKGPLILVLAAICIGSAPLGLRFSSMEPSATAFWRFTFALPILFIAARIFKQHIGRPNIAVLLAGACLSLDICIWHLALVRTSVANATFIVNLGAIAVGLLAWLFLKQRPSLLWPIAAILALSGAMIMAFAAPEAQSGKLQGDALAFIAAFCLSGYLLFASIGRRTKTGFQTVFWMTTSGIIVALIFTLFMGEEIIPQHYTQFGGALLLALFSQSLGQGLLVYGMGLTKPAIAGVILLIQPVVAGLMAWPLFGEALALTQMAGAALILVGVWLAGKSK